jgi:hypothetical protein
MLNSISSTGRGPIIQRDFEHRGLDCDHDNRLCQQSSGVVLSKPEEDPENVNINLQSYCERAIGRAVGQDLTSGSKQ